MFADNFSAIAVDSRNAKSTAINVCEAYLAHHCYGETMKRLEIEYAKKKAVRDYKPVSDSATEND
ncbi:hypothetical protein [Providencia huaxiensis]|uniref:hypothetical protein n=1 Tax=Providencia huaxiensis TaxID=2027290 RepID=UPI0034DD665E